MIIALLHLTNILRSCPIPGKVLDPTLIPSNLRQQTVSSSHPHCYKLDDMPHYRVRYSCVVSMYTCRICLGYLNVWEMHQLTGFCLFGCGIWYCRGYCDYASSCLGVESFETGLEKEGCSGFHVCLRVIVSQPTSIILRC